MTLGNIMLVNVSNPFEQCRDCGATSADGVFQAEILAWAYQRIANDTPTPKENFLVRGSFVLLLTYSNVHFHHHRH